MSKIANPQDIFSEDILERGKGEAVAEIKEYWDEMGIEEMHARILQWKENSGVADATRDIPLRYRGLKPTPKIRRRAATKKCHVLGKPKLRCRAATKKRQVLCKSRGMIRVLLSHPPDLVRFLGRVATS